MAPARIKKKKMSTDNDKSVRQQTTGPESPAVTPQISPQKRIMSITEGQKQALIDNLQLEVTERARKLRAQYALQAQSLRTRIELRINRIPTALRKANMGELCAKYEEMKREKPKTSTTEKPKVVVQDVAIQDKESVPKTRATKSVAEVKSRGTKRNSDTMESATKESITIHEDPIANPKKRTKVAANAATRQPPNPSTVLSPKSANSRTLPQSPLRPNLGSPQKSYNSHLTSPLKPIAVPVKAATVALAGVATEKAKPGRPKSAASKSAARRAAAAKNKREGEKAADSEGLRTVSSISNSSALSNGTTIVKNAKNAPVATAAQKKGGVKAAGKKIAGVVDAPPVGRRVLRKR